MSFKDIRFKDKLLRDFYFVNDDNLNISSNIKSNKKISYSEFQSNLVSVAEIWYEKMS